MVVYDETIEIEANYFAMCLLMPKKILLAMLHSLFPQGKTTIDVSGSEFRETMQYLANRFGVDENIMTLRSLNLMRDNGMLLY